MKVGATNLSHPARATLRSWGWQLSEEKPDAFLSSSGPMIEIRTAPTVHADDIVFLPLKQEELRKRIEMAKDRQSRLAKRLHDLRSPLNAIQGYAEILAETVDGEALRYASNIRTASELLTTRLENISDEGV